MDYYDTLETQEPAAREQRLCQALVKQIAHAKTNTAYYANALAAFDASSINSRETLATLPVTHKSDLMEQQAAQPPFGGLSALQPGQMAQIFQSPGPIYEFRSQRPDFWRMGRGLFAAGFRAGDVVHNTFSYHFTPAGMMFEAAAQALGCAVFPAGVGQTELQVKAMADIKPTAYAGTPSFLKVLLDKAAELNLDVTSVKKAMVGGEALPPSLRAELKDRGVNVYQCYGTADLGLIAYESPLPEGMIIDEDVIVEIVRPGTGDPVPDDEVGEVVVTTFNEDYPLIRFATGDMSAVLAGASSCGRTNMRIKGWLGRADQTTKIKGMFVRPNQVAEVLKRHPEVVKGRLVVDSKDHMDVMTLQCEVNNSDDSLAQALANTVRDVCKLRGDIVFVEVDSLPNDGKVIDDIRSYE